MVSPAAGNVSETSQPDASVPRLAASWVSAAGNTARYTAELALAEAKLAAVSVLMMMLLTAFSVACLLGAWGLVVAGMVYGLVQLGVALPLALLALGMAHAALAVVFWRSVVRLSYHLDFPATSRHLGTLGDDDEDVDQPEARS